MSHFLKLAFSFLLTLALSQLALATTITTVKGKKVVIELDGAAVGVGDEFFLINPANNKKMAIIRITKFNDKKAIADIQKGSAQVGYSLQAKAPSSGTSAGVVKYGNAGILPALKDSYGAVGGYLMNSMTASVSSNTYPTAVSTGMSGTGFSVGGFYDSLFSSDIVGRGSVALEQFSASGTTTNPVCANSKNCTANITYLSLYGLLKWYANQGSYRNWVGGGAGYLIAMSKSSSALNESQISTNQVFTFAYGCDVQMSRQNYIPISLEYNLFPSSATVKANQIMLKAGWAWNL